MKTRTYAASSLLACAALSYGCVVAAPESAIATNVDSASQSLTETDVTPTSGNDVDMQGTSANFVDALYDKNLETFAKIDGPQAQFIYRLAKPTAVTNYELTSASDADYPERDPKAWTLEGSRNGTDWEVLDTRSNELFSSRKQVRNFSISASNPNRNTPYLWVRLNVTAINWPYSGGVMHLGEFRVGGIATASTVPSTPVIAAPVIRGASLTLSWTATGASSYIVRRYSDDGGMSETVVSGTTFNVSNLLPGTAVSFTVQAVNGALRGFPASVAAAAPLAAGLKDITALSATAPLAQSDGGAPWLASQVVDNYGSTKWYAGVSNPTGWIRQDAALGSVVTRYTITAANDFPARDPKAWTLEGSNDLTQPWTVIDTRQAQSFSVRRQVRTFSCNPSGQAFQYYRLNISANNGATDGLQLSEWRLFGTSSATLAAPAAPSSALAVALSNDQIQLRIANHSTRLNPETTYTVDRATNAAFSQNLVSRTIPSGPTDDNVFTDYRAFNLAPATQYYFRVKANNPAGTSAYTAVTSATTKSVATPATWKEAWHGRSGNLSLISSNTNLAVYKDQWVTSVTGPAQIAWLTPALEEAWAYAKTTYPLFSGPQLAVILEQGGDIAGDPHPAYSMASVMYPFTPENDYRGLMYSFNGDWSVQSYTGWSFGSLIHELNHIVEANNNETMNSPSYSVWGDSHWGEAFIYDTYLHLAGVPATNIPAGLASSAKAEWWEARDQGNRWFQDWYFPLYQGELGNGAASKKGAQFLAKYFQLLSQNAPRNGNTYQRSLNLGEYIHLCSGAAGVNLTSTAIGAFHLYRRPEVLAQLAQAQLDYPAVSALYLANRAPVFAVDPIVRTGTVGSALSAQTLANTAADADLNATLSYSLVSGPAWLTVAANGTLAGTPTAAGSFTAQVRVTDNGGLTATATLNLTVTAGSGAGPCSGLCSPATVFSTQSYQSPQLGTGATCHETTVNLNGALCGNFNAGRTFKINNTAVTCNGSAVTLPVKRNSGYCFQASAGTPAWAYFSTY